MMILNSKYKKGMTLVETLVAITVLLTAVVGPMVIYARSIMDARYAGDRITASYLAQEGIEYLKQKVYTNMNIGGSTGWLDGFNPCSGNPNCKVDAYNDTICWNAGANCSSFLKLSSIGAYNHNLLSSGTDSIFQRSVSIVENIPNQEATISATVSWTRAGSTKSVTITEHIFKWR